MMRRSLFLLMTTAAAFLAVLTHAHGQPTKILIQEWDLPKPNTFPHDPLATADGSLWYTGMNANLLGRLDPKTGQQTARCGPGPPHASIRPKGHALVHGAEFESGRQTRSSDR